MSQLQWLMTMQRPCIVRCKVSMTPFHDAKVLCSCVSKWVSCCTQDSNINVFCHLVFFASVKGDSLHAVELNAHC